MDGFIPGLVLLVVVAWLAAGFFSFLWLKFKADDHERRILHLEDKALYRTADVRSFKNFGER